MIISERFDGACCPDAGSPAVSSSNNQVIPYFVLAARAPERILRMRVWCFFLILAALAVPLFAQSEDAVENGSRIANVKVWVAPVKGGTEEARAYFDFNMPEEVKGSGYLLAESREDSDFYILFTLDHDEEYGDEVVIAELYTTATNALIITNSMGYTAVEDMNDWNLTVIYQLMANAPLNKYIAGEWTGPGPGSPVVQADYPLYWLNLGLRAGYSMRSYTIPKTGYLERDNNQGHSFEAAFQVSSQVLRFLAVQVEMAFTGDTVPFTGYNYNEDGKTTTQYRDEFISYSMMIPLMVKGTFQIDQLMLNPFGGIYLTAPLGDMDEAGKKSGYSYDPPLGWTAGVELGWQLGQKGTLGTVFMDIRYAGDFGDAVRSSRGSIYQRGMVTFSAGYRYGFFKKTQR
jgi:hypothetical protein